MTSEEVVKTIMEEAILRQNMANGLEAKYSIADTMRKYMTIYAKSKCDEQRELIRQEYVSEGAEGGYAVIGKAPMPEFDYD